jgi:hypothetical protein
MNLNNIAFMKAAYESGTGVDACGYEYAIDAYEDERCYEEPWPVAYGEERFNPRRGRGRGRGGYSRGRGTLRGSYEGSRGAAVSRPPYNPARSFTPGPPGASYDCGQLGSSSSVAVVYWTPIWISGSKPRRSIFRVSF